MAQRFLTSIDLNQNELISAVIQNLSTTSRNNISAVEGQIVYDVDIDSLIVYSPNHHAADNDGWVHLNEGDISAIVAGTGLTGGGTTGSVTLNLADTLGSSAPYGNTLDTTNGPGVYGSGTAIPSIDVDAQGRIVGIEEYNISTTLSFSDGSTSGSLNLLSESLTIAGGTGVTSTANDAANSVTLSIGQSVGTSDSVTFSTVTANLIGDVYASNGTSLVLDSGTDGTDATFTGDVTGDLTGTADVATSVTATANNTTDETVYITFVDGATGTQGIETDTGLTYNPSTGILTTTSFAGDLTGNVTGNADTASSWLNARTVTFATGDVTGSFTIDGSADISNVNLSVNSVQADSVALGTDTTGNYMVDVSAGTGVTVTHTPGEGSTATVAIGQAVGTGDSVTFDTVTGTNGGTFNDIQVGVTTANEIDTTAGDLILDSFTGTVQVTDQLVVGGNLTVNGTTTTVNSNIITVDDSLLMLADGNTSSDSIDIGFYGIYDPAGTDLYAGLFRDATDNKWKLFVDLETAPGTSPNLVDTAGTGYTVATLVANLEGDVTGDVTGDLTGDVYASDGTSKVLESGTNGTDATFTGDVTGDLTGNVSGDLTGDVKATNGTVVLDNGTDGTDATFTGDVTGDLTGNVSGNVTGNVTAGNIQVGVTGTNEIDTTSGNLTIDSAGGTVVVDDNLTVNGTTLTFDGVGVTAIQESTDAFVDNNTTLMTAAAAEARFIRKYAADIVKDTGETTEITITHNLGSEDVIVQVYENSSNDTVFVEVTRVDANTVDLTFAAEPTDNDYRVVVVG